MYNIMDQKILKFDLSGRYSPVGIIIISQNIGKFGSVKLLDDSITFRPIQWLGKKNVHIVGPYSFETDMAVLLGISWLADVTSI